MSELCSSAMCVADVVSRSSYRAHRTASASASRQTPPAPFFAHRRLTLPDSYCGVGTSFIGPSAHCAPGARVSYMSGDLRTSMPPPRTSAPTIETKDMAAVGLGGSHVCLEQTGEAERRGRRPTEAKS